MIFQNVAIESIEYVTPPITLTSGEIEEQIAGTLERLELRRGFIKSSTGVRERRCWDPGTTPSEIATVAARKAIDASGINPQEIGCVISTSITKEYIEPSMASLIHGNLKLRTDCLIYDVGNACLGFMNGMYNVALMIESQQIKYGLIVAGEVGKQVLDRTLERLRQTDVVRQEFLLNLATLTLGEGAVAMIMCQRDRSRAGHRINGAVGLSDTSHSRDCVATPDMMLTDSAALIPGGIALLSKTWSLAHKEFGTWGDDHIDVYAPHQVSALGAKLGIQAMDATRSKFTHTYPFFGNTGSVGVPGALAYAHDSGQLRPGHRVCLAGLGSGLNCMIMGLTW